MHPILQAQATKTLSIRDRAPSSHRLIVKVRTQEKWSLRIIWAQLGCTDRDAYDNPWLVTNAAITGKDIILNTSRASRSYYPEIT